MKAKLILFFLAMLCFFSGFSQEKIQKYSKAKIFYTQKSDLQLMLDSGIAVDHGIHKKNIFITSVFSEWEIEKAKALGFTVEIEIDDMQKYISNRKTEKNITNASCSSNNYITPTNFELGSMGGFYTYAQMLSELDQMHTLYPNLITVKAPISNFVTSENRVIYSVKISDNPTVDENEPEILFSAIHHAREPASMQQLIFYMWYLLENYATNPEIASIINNTEQYFIPVLNPDGYVYNETTNPNGGGFWRKNRRNNTDGSVGVDNNRNYSFHWNESGVSSSGSGQTWPGTAGFSEPENQAMKWFTEQHNFIMALNNHTHSGLLLYPFGYAENTPTIEDSLFSSISELMVSENGYVNQISADLYAASGDSDDWMYADTSTKNKIYAMTPEIGYSFWPAQNGIISLCKSMLYHNITAAHLITNYAIIKDKTPEFILNLSGNFDYSIQRFGLQNPANFTVQIQPISANILSVGAAQIHNGMVMSQLDNNGISFSLNNAIQNGDEIVYKIILNNGEYDEEQLITKVYGNPTTAFVDNGNSTSNYNNGSVWSATTSAFYSASSSITDSVTGNYSDNLDSSIELTNTIDLTQAGIAKLSFYAKWDIEAGWDYVQFEISTDNGATWIPQCGKFTKNGLAQQSIEGQPMYDGTQSTWVKEEIDLSDYLGEQIKFRFQIVSDGNTTGDGFYFDDFEVKVFNSNPASVIKNDFLNASVYPNPVLDKLFIEIPNLNNEVQIKMYSIKGQLIKSIKTSKIQVSIDMSNLSSGVYFINLLSDKKIKRYSIIKL